MKNVAIKNLVVGKEYVFGHHSAVLGFVPTNCHKGACRLVVASVGRKYVKAVGVSGNFDGEGFYEVDVAKEGYRASLVARKEKNPDHPVTYEDIERFVQNL